MYNRYRLATRIRGLLVLIISVGLATIFIAPILYTISSSLKPVDKIFVLPIQWIPRNIRFLNFVEPLVKRKFYVYFINSLFVASIVTSSEVLLSSMAGYSLAKFNYRGSRTIFMLVLVTMMVPIEVTIVPLALVVRFFGMINTYQALIIPVLVTPFAIFWMRQFMLTIPKDYAEAARIDGLGEFRIFARIILPLCKPAISALVMFTFMGNWNSFIWPFIAVSKDRLRTFPVGLASFEGEFFTFYNELFAMAVVAIVPPIIVFLILRTRLMRGMAMVGIKG
jgi:ABC-type glycerol-3-phosphate transport system permease component